MTKKLLHITLKYYALFSLIMMLITAPLFYYISLALYFHETDEALIALKEEFLVIGKEKLKQYSISDWNQLNRDVIIEENNKNIQRDTIYNLIIYNQFHKEDEPYRILKTPITVNDKNYILSARINLVDDKDFIKSTGILFVILLLVLLIGLFVITKVLSLRLWRPFYKTLSLIEQFEIDKNSTPVLANCEIEEFNRLNHSIDDLIAKNTQIYKSQKEFVENAAHELQTPIAIFKGKLEVFLQRNDVTKEQFKIIDELTATTAKFSRLNKNLLLLSKLESDQFNLIENVLLDEVIAHQLSFFEEQAMAKKITIKTKLESNVTKVTDLFLMEILISNLFLNAVNHTPKKGCISVILNQNYMSFSNSANDNPLEESVLFQRFSKVDSSSKGNGLGLSIVKKITDLNQWEIKYYFDKNEHIFVIAF